MALPGLIAANNLSDAADREAVWDNLGASITANIGLLVEEAGTNLLLRSEEFDNAGWTKVRSSISANVIAAPNGTLTADKLVEDSTPTNTHVITQAIALSDNVSVTYGLYAKKAERSIIRIQLTNKANTICVAYFNVDTGVVSNQSNATGSIVNAGNGWYRCSISFNSESGATSPTALIGLATIAGTASYSGDGTSGLFLWGAQLEAGAFPTSYIATTGATATRAAGVVSITNSAFSSWYSGSSALIVIEGSDILELQGAKDASVADFVRIKNLSSPAQPRLTAAATDAASGTVLRDNALLKASPSSEGDFFITRGALDGQSLRVNGLAIASISGSPFSGSTASCPLLISSFAAPTNLRISNAMVSGALAFPEKAIPIETDQFILYAKVGQS